MKKRVFSDRWKMLKSLIVTHKRETTVATQLSQTFPSIYEENNTTLFPLNYHALSTLQRYSLFVVQAYSDIFFDSLFSSPFSGSIPISACTSDSPVFYFYKKRAGNIEFPITSSTIYLF